MEVEGRKNVSRAKWCGGEGEKCKQSEMVWRREKAMARMDVRERVLVACVVGLC